MPATTKEKKMKKEGEEKKKRTDKQPSLKATRTWNLQTFKAAIPSPRSFVVLLRLQSPRGAASQMRLFVLLDGVGGMHT